MDKKQRRSLVSRTLERRQAIRDQIVLAEEEQRTRAKQAAALIIVIAIVAFGAKFALENAAIAALGSSFSYGDPSAYRLPNDPSYTLLSSSAAICENFGAVACEKPAVYTMRVNEDGSLERWVYFGLRNNEQDGVYVKSVKVAPAGCTQLSPRPMLTGPGSTRPINLGCPAGGRPFSANVTVAYNTTASGYTRHASFTITTADSTIVTT